MRIGFRGEVWEWRGPAPYYFVTVPAPESDDIRAVSGDLTYGWGMIPVQVRLGDTEWATSLWPKDGAYVVPLRAHARRAEGVEAGMTVDVRLNVGDAP